MLVLSNDDKQDENMTIKEDNDKDDNDTSIYNITKKKKNEMLVRVNSSWCQGYRNRFKPTFNPFIAISRHEMATKSVVHNDNDSFLFELFGFSHVYVCLRMSFIIVVVVYAATITLASI